MTTRTPTDSGSHCQTHGDRGRCTRCGHSTNFRNGNRCTVTDPENRCCSCSDHRNDPGAHRRATAIARRDH